MPRLDPAPLPWAALSAGAVVCVLAAATVPNSRAPLAVMAAGLGLGAVVAYGTARTRAGLPCAAVAWLGAGCVGVALGWGLGEEYQFGYALAVLQILVGVAMLPGHLKRSARQTAARARGTADGG